MRVGRKITLQNFTLAPQAKAWGYKNKARLRGLLLAREGGLCSYSPTLEGGG